MGRNWSNCFKACVIVICVFQGYFLTVENDVLVPDGNTFFNYKLPLAGVAIVGSLLSALMITNSAPTYTLNVTFTQAQPEMTVIRKASQSTSVARCCRSIRCAAGRTVFSWCRDALDVQQCVQLSGVLLCCLVQLCHLEGFLKR